MKIPISFYPRGYFAVCCIDECDAKLQSLETTLGKSKACRVATGHDMSFLKRRQFLKRYHRNSTCQPWVPYFLYCSLCFCSSPMHDALQNAKHLVLQNALPTHLLINEKIETNKHILICGLLLSRQAYCRNPDMKYGCQIMLFFFGRLAINAFYKQTK